MARPSFSTVRVALSALIVFLFSIHPVLPQHSRATTITYSCRATNLESVIEYLSRTSGYHFIYSRDMIDVTRPVSLNVSNRPIDEVLTLIAKQVNLAFKIQHRHIILKAIPKAELPVTPETIVQNTVARKVTKPVIIPIETQLLSSVGKNLPAAPAFSSKKILESRLDRRINELQAMLGPNVPRNISPMYVNRINFNNRHAGWFASVGTIVNDHSTGVELQGGVRYLYGVVQPRWSVERGLYGVYGFGNSFTLMRNFSFNTIYMFSGSKQSDTIYPFSPIAKTGPEFQLTQTMRHHQVKFAVQYAIARNFTVRAGPVLNYKTTVNEVVPATGNYGYYEGTIIFRQQGGMPDIVYQNGQFVRQSIRHMESWVGWEAAVSYRVNFSNRP